MSWVFYDLKLLWLDFDRSCIMTCLHLKDSCDLKWIIYSHPKSLSQFAMYMYDSMAQVIIHVPYHCLIKNNTEWDKLHGWQVLWGDYDHSKSREDGNCPVLKKGMTTQNRFQACEVQIWPVFLDDSVLSWCRRTDCLYLPPIIAIT